MAKIVVAFRERDAGETIASMLRESGYEVIRVCTAGDEVKRVFQMIQDGILICGFRLKDRTVDQILEDLSGRAEVLCISKAEQTAQLRAPHVFHITPPVKKSVLAAWADMLVQLHYQHIPLREETDRDRIRQAKEKLMTERNITEKEAHRYLQKLSMRFGIPMSRIAEQILERNTE